jgi:ATP-dependent Lon protease
MTGETARGLVLIGGVKEKVLAALRAGTGNAAARNRK